MRAPRTIRPAPRGPLSPKWRNWQTRQVQDLVPVKGVEVRVLSSALAATLRRKDLRERRVSPFFVARDGPASRMAPNTVTAVLILDCPNCGEHVEIPSLSVEPPAVRFDPR